MRNSRPVLLAEDDSVDAMTVKRALKDLNVTSPLVHTLNGEEALKHLKSNDNEKPCVILLDLNMPRMNGIEFLKVVKSDNELRKIPVVVLTTSQESRDKFDTFRLGIAGYIVKPAEYKKFVEAIKTINLYWTLSELPNGDE
ncbi:MAG: response regulator [Sedimentisphaerales bacterium]|nr:response regulator [Sedimentisphaerales bacterium]